MPTAMRIGRYRFFFYSNEGIEPAHIHVQAGGAEAKYWLRPVSLARNSGFNIRELQQVESHIRENLAYLIEVWNQHFGNNRDAE